jgi:hypothetical protein
MHNLRMKIGALLGVMDEVALLPRCIAHLKRIGIDRVLALDGGSTDGSLALLQAHQGEWLQVMSMPPATLADSDLAADFETDQAQSSGCDWVICLDADELWLPASGALRDSSQWHDSGVELITVRRFNVVPSLDADPLPAVVTPAQHADLWLFAGQIANFREHLELEPETRWVSNAPKAKIAVRPDRIGKLRTGWHSAIGPGGAKLRRQASRDIIAAHLPFTTPARFRQKVNNIRRLLVDHPQYFAPDGAWHWRRWAELDSAEAIDREFSLQCVPPDEKAGLCQSGAILSAQALLQSLP